MMHAQKMIARWAAWIFTALVLILTAGLLSRVAARPGAGVTWSIESSLETRTIHDPKTGDTQDIRDTSEAHSSDCQDLYSEQTNHADRNGSHDSDDIDWSNDKGDSAYQQVTVNEDPNGNVTRHTTISWTEPDGSRTTVWSDEVWDPSTGKYKWKDGGSKRDKVPPLSEPHWSGTISATRNMNEVSTSSDCPAVANVNNLQCQGTSTNTIQWLATASLRPTGPEALISRKCREVSASQVTITGSVRCNQAMHTFKHVTNSSVTEEGQTSTRGGVSVYVDENGQYQIKFTAPGLKGIMTRSGSDTLENRCMSVSRSDSQPPDRSPTSWSDWNYEVKGQVDPKHPDSLSGQQVEQSGKMTETIAWSFTRRSRCPGQPGK